MQLRHSVLVICFFVIGCGDSSNNAAAVGPVDAKGDETSAISESDSHGVKAAEVSDSNKSISNTKLLDRLYALQVITEGVGHSSTAPVTTDRGNTLEDGDSTVIGSNALTIDPKYLGRWYAINAVAEGRNITVTPDSIEIFLFAPSWTREKYNFDESDNCAERWTFDLVHEGDFCLLRLQNIDKSLINKMPILRLGPVEYLEKDFDSWFSDHAHKSGILPLWTFPTIEDAMASSNGTRWGRFVRYAHWDSYCRELNEKYLDEIERFRSSYDPKDGEFEVDISEITAGDEDYGLEKYRYGNTDSQFTGTTIEYSECGQTQYRNTYLAGRLARYEIRTVDGQHPLHIKRYNPYHEKDGVLHGETARFNSKNQCWKKMHYKNGEAHGLWERYYDNGQIEWRGFYRDGEMSGLWKWYHKNGQLRTWAWYLDDYRHYSYAEYGMSGELIEMNHVYTKSSEEK